jgi:hypothetical protein
MKPETEAKKERDAWGFVGLIVGAFGVALVAALYGLYCLILK